MNKFRKSGSVAALFVEGKMPAPRSDGFLAALRGQRFRTIEDAASEERSVGWVTSEDPTGEQFAIEDLEHDHAIWLRMRVDRKQLPSKWVAIYRAAAERSAGRKLTTREKQELKQDLLEKLLPRVLPTVAFVDALWFPDEHLMLLFATSRSTRESFDTLFCKTFDARLLASDPYLLALRSGIGQQQQTQLDTLSAVKWPKETRAPRNASSKAVAEVQ